MSGLVECDRLRHAASFAGRQSRHDEGMQRVPWRRAVRGGSGGRRGVLADGRISGSFCTGRETRISLYDSCRRMRQGGKCPGSCGVRRLAGGPWNRPERPSGGAETLRRQKDRHRDVPHKQPADPGGPKGRISDPGVHGCRASGNTEYR